MNADFSVAEARITLRLTVETDLDPLPALNGGRRISVKEVLYERNLLTGVEELEVLGRPTTGHHRSGAALAASVIAVAPEELRAEWLAEARRIAADIQHRGMGS